MKVGWQTQIRNKCIKTQQPELLISNTNFILISCKFEIKILQVKLMIFWYFYVAIKNVTSVGTL